MNTINNILVVLPNPMGDAVLSGPALRRLRKAFPESRITWLGTGPVCELLGDSPWADERISYPGTKRGEGALIRTAAWLRSFQFDSVILLTNSFRSAMLAWSAGIPRRIGYRRDGRGMLLSLAVEPLRWSERYAPISMIDYYGMLIDRAISHLGGGEYFGYIGNDRRLELFSGPENLKKVQLLGCWDLYGEQRPVMLVPGGAFGPSKWWPAERYAELADRLITQQRCFVILCCSPNAQEQALAAQIAAAAKQKIYNLAEDRVDLGVLKELIRRSRLVIANDTGPCHIAAAFGVPLVTIFGPTDPRWTATGYDREIRLRVDVPCGPCQLKQCPTPDEHRCLDDIRVEDVYAAACQLLADEKSNSLPDENGAGPGLSVFYRVYNEGFVPLADGSGLVHDSYRLPLDRAGLGTLDGIFSFDRGELLDKPGLSKSRQRFRLRLKLNGEKRSVLYLKRYEQPASMIGRVFRRREKTDSVMRDFVNAVELAEHGISVPRPIAYGQKRTDNGRQRSFVLFEEVPNGDALERLIPKWRYMRHDYKLLRNRRKLVEQLAMLVRQLHQSGYVHRDLYLSHIFIGKTLSGDERLTLIDLQRVFKPSCRHQRWQIKDLAQLAYSSREYIQGGDVVRFLRVYFDIKRLDKSSRVLIRQIQSKVNRIARHDRKKKLKAEQGD